MSGGEDPELLDLAEGRARGEVDDYRWAVAVAAHGIALERLHDQAAGSRQAMAQLERPAMPPELAARIRSAASVPEPMADDPEPTGENDTDPVSPTSATEQPRHPVVHRPRRWRVIIPALIAAGLAFAVVPILWESDPESASELDSDGLYGSEPTPIARAEPARDQLDSTRAPRRAEPAQTRPSESTPEDLPRSGGRGGSTTSDSTGAAAALVARGAEQPPAPQPSEGAPGELAFDFEEPDQQDDAFGGTADAPRESREARPATESRAGPLTAKTATKAEERRQEDAVQRSVAATSEIADDELLAVDHGQAEPPQPDAARQSISALPESEGGERLAIADRDAATRLDSLKTESRADASVEEDDEPRDRAGSESELQELARDARAFLAERADDTDQVPPPSATVQTEALLVAAERRARAGGILLTEVAVPTTPPEADAADEPATRTVEVGLRRTADPQGRPTLQVSLTHAGPGTLPLFDGQLRVEGLDPAGEVRWRSGIPAPGPVVLGRDSSLAWSVALTGDLAPPPAVTQLRLLGSTGDAVLDLAEPSDADRE